MINENSISASREDDHEKCVCMKTLGSSYARFVLSFCDSIKDSSSLETIDDDLGTALQRFPRSRNEPANALCLDDRS